MLVPEQQNYWFMCCANCTKAIRGDLGWTIWCEACKENSTIELRYHLEVSLTDETSSMCVDLYGEDAEQLLTYKVNALYEQKEQGIDIGAKIKTEIEGKHVICYIKYYDRLVRDETIRKFPVLKMYQI